jgi:hypothetical protein
LASHSKQETRAAASDEKERDARARAAAGHAGGDKDRVWRK